MPCVVRTKNKEKPKHDDDKIRYIRWQQHCIIIVVVLPISCNAQVCTSNNFLISTFLQRRAQCTTANKMATEFHKMQGWLTRSSGVARRWFDYVRYEYASFRCRAMKRPFVCFFGSQPREGQSERPLVLCNRI